MSLTSRNFLWSSLGAAVSQRYAGASPPRSGTASGEKETHRPIPFGSGDFGRWSQDEFGLPIFCYTANQTADPVPSLTCDRAFWGQGNIFTRSGMIASRPLRPTTEQFA